MIHQVVFLQQLYRLCMQKTNISFFQSPNHPHHIATTRKVDQPHKQSFKHPYLQNYTWLHYNERKGCCILFCFLSSLKKLHSQRLDFEIGKENYEKCRWFNKHMQAKDCKEPMDRYYNAYKKYKWYCKFDFNRSNNFLELKLPDIAKDWSSNWIMLKT